MLHNKSIGQPGTLDMNTDSDVELDTVDIANRLLTYAIGGVDAQFYPGYSAEHPTLAAAFMQVCMLDIASRQQYGSLDEIRDTIGYMTETLQAELEKFHYEN